jgi:hypothetical protein
LDMEKDCRTIRAIKFIALMVLKSLSSSKQDVVSTGITNTCYR